MGNSNFINVNINVDGKIHKVKIEEGIGLTSNNGNTSNAIFEGSIFNAKSKETEYGGEWHWTKGKEIKMNASEFALFKNIADNCKEGNDIIFSKDDLNKAFSLYENGKFTIDINKNLPKGDFAKPEMQDRRGYEYLKAASKHGEVGFSLLEEDQWGDFNSDIAKALNNGTTDTVITSWSYGDSPDITHGYIDKDGWFCNLDGNKLSRTATDKNGNKIKVR